VTATSTSDAVSGVRETDFAVPDLGEGLEELTIVSWLVHAGEAVALNQPLCLVETAKAEVEIPSPHDGVLVAQGGVEGDTLQVGAMLARFRVAESAVETAAQPMVPPAPSTRQATLVGYGHDESIDRSRRRRSGRDTAAAPYAPAISVATTVPHVPDEPARPRAKPPVRKLARALGVDLRVIEAGTGPDGTFTRDDVRTAATSATPGSTSDTAAPAGVRVVPVTGVRRRIAERMTTSRQRIPDATCSVTVDCTRLLDVRATVNEVARRRDPDANITPFALMCKFAVLALGSVPMLNASFDESQPSISIHDVIHLGVGTATERGLMVAVVRDAQRRSTGDLAGEINRLAAAARDGTLAPRDMVGSTFTVSNFGALGLDDGIPVINHPEAGILGIGAVKPRPHVVDGELAVRTTAAFTLAFDHRVIDGTEAARFLGQLRELVEQPELALVVL
jgi:pyruvate dehydrogenase E2 component (dihydrolipoamide acetyltransferase)